MIDTEDCGNIVGKNVGNEFQSGFLLLDTVFSSSVI